MGERLLADDANGNPQKLKQTAGSLHVSAPATTEDILQLALMQGQMMETLTAMLVELKTITHFIQAGLNVSDNPESVRSDISTTTTTTL